MLAAAEPQVINKRGDRVTDGGHSPPRIRMLGLSWFLVLQETTSPTTAQMPL